MATVVFFFLLGDLVAIRSFRHWTTKFFRFFATWKPSDHHFIPCSLVLKYFNGHQVFFFSFHMEI